jgi:hypothetical protein
MVRLIPVKCGPSVQAHAASQALPVLVGLTQRPPQTMFVVSMSTSKANLKHLPRKGPDRGLFYFHYFI